MSSDPSFSPEKSREGISLEELAQAFAEVMGQAPRERTGEEPAAEPAQSAAAGEGRPDPAAAPAVEEDHCPITPRSLLEVMLFVGNREGKPLTAGEAAELMRDVAAEEIPALVEELNARYDAENCPYHVVSEGEGYRLTLKKEFAPVRTRLYGKIREARLSQAAIDVLAIVAYKQPLTGEEVSKLRGKPSSHILAQLVRRSLLRVARHEGRRMPHYHTTERFLRLFDLQSLSDLPRSEEPE